MPSIGPSIPQAQPDKRKRSREGDDSDLSDSSSSSTKASKATSDNKRARVLGPSLPPAPLDERPREAHTDENEITSSSEEDDEFGPSLLSTNIDSLQPAPAMAKALDDTATSAPAKRDDWMLIAPSNGDWASKIDPTKLKNRKFNTGKGAKGPSQNVGSTDSSWHETIAEKQARLQREMMGIADSGTKGNSSHSTRNHEQKNDQKADQRLKDYTEQSRGPSLYKSHTKSNPQDQDDDPSARAFDREKDIAGGLQINQTQRREMVKKASDFQSRFSSSKYL